MLKLITKITAAIAVVSIALFSSANAKTLKIETHFTASSPNGEVAAQFAKNVEKFSGGSLKYKCSTHHQLQESLLRFLTLHKLELLTVI